MTAVKVQGRAIHFEWLSEVRSPRALVVLNTVTGDTRIWRRLYRSLTGRLPIISFDVRNRGLSTFTGRPASVREQLEDVWALLQKSDVSYPVWVGHSAGTSLAYRAAATLGGSSGLVLLAPLFSFGMELKIRLLRSVLLEALSDTTLKQFHNLCCALTYSGHYLEQHPAVVPTGLARLRTLFTLESLRVACEQTFFPDSDDLSLLKRVTCPALVVRPQEEEIMPREVTESAACCLQECRLEVVPGGHRLLEEAPEVTFEKVASFFDESA